MSKRTTKAAAKAETGSSNEIKGGTQYEDESSIDEHGPIRALQGKCTGFLLARLGVWLERFPELPRDLGMLTWQEMRPYAHVQQQALSEMLRTTVNSMAGENQQLHMSIPHALQLGQLLSELAKDNYIMQKDCLHQGDRQHAQGGHRKQNLSYPGTQQS